MLNSMLAPYINNSKLTRGFHFISFGLFGLRFVFHHLLFSMCRSNNSWMYLGPVGTSRRSHKTNSWAEINTDRYSIGQWEKSPPARRNKQSGLNGMALPCDWDVDGRFEIAGWTGEPVADYVGGLNSPRMTLHNPGNMSVTLVYS